MCKLRLKIFWQDESGATALEYGIIVGLIGVLIVGATQDLTGKLIALLDQIGVKLDSVFKDTSQ
ncbi:MAG: Flp family type IVb pilin [Cohaesibacter sp.]|nr:Flp family type IVb pilin [Cohaesibacter sp.]MCV6601430.1 Flp family type IVb pilin [Cohaesibacter sp.]